MKGDKTQVYTADEIKAITELAWKDFKDEVKDCRLSPLALIFQYQTEYAREIIEAAREYQRSHGHDADGFIFALDGQIIPQRCINSLLMKYCKILDIPYRSSHKNRKSYGSALLNNGVSINTARQMLGHADEETTLKYYCYDQSLSSEKEKSLEKALGGRSL